jgi:DNA-binding NarL/FixJ family response regulator
MNLIIVDDHTILRRSLITMLANENLHFIADFSNGRELIESGRFNDADVILLDVSMPVMGGIECCQWFQQNQPHVKILALSMNEDEMSILHMIRAGARGYVLKTMEPSELVSAIRDVHVNGFHFCDLVSQEMALEENRGRDMHTEGPALTKREYEFLMLSCSELAYKEIADKMNISVKTVDGHREQLFDKLGVKNRVGLVLYAVREGFFKP